VYDPYGNVVSISDDIGNSAYAGLRGEDFSFGFSTKFHDREVGLIAYQLRSYSPALGRWLNRDPIEERGGVNLYGFCHNNSNVHYDGLGYEEIKSIIVKKKPIRWTKIYC
jgi:RHS repeat-associated protein